jgi:hypothetical protein
MRFKTLVLIPVIAVLATYVASLPVTQSQISANAPQSEVIDKNKINKDEYKGLHELVDREIGYWLWQTDNKRDYNLNLLV